MYDLPWWLEPTLEALTARAVPVRWQNSCLLFYGVPELLPLRLAIYFSLAQGFLSPI